MQYMNKLSPHAWSPCERLLGGGRGRGSNGSNMKKNMSEPWLRIKNNKER